jgi:hypothetical protein
MKIDVINGVTVLNPKDFTVITEMVDMGNFYGKPFKRRFILLEVNRTCKFLEKKCKGFVFSNNLI